MLNQSKWISGILASSAMAVLGGCGDGPLCPSELKVVIQSPSPGTMLSSAEDKNATEAGTQITVMVRSNLNDGDPMVLTVTDADNAVAQFNTTVDGDGDATFTDVTVPNGKVSLQAAGTSVCGRGEDVVDVTVQTAADCDLAILEGPIANDFYAPIPVLNSTVDSDGTLADFQANLRIQTSPGFSVEALKLDTQTGEEVSIGTEVANEDGMVAFATTMVQGRHAVRATCRSGSISEASATNTLQVDTLGPTCTFTDPAEGVTITPDDDAQGDTSDGIQVIWNARVDDGEEDDTIGEPVVFFRDEFEIPGTAINIDGETSTDGFAEFTSPGLVSVRVAAQDHAGNRCEAGHDLNIVLAGCPIEFVEPNATVIVDGNGNDTDGMQADVVVNVGAECMGQTVSVDCGLGELSAVAGVDGRATIPAVTLSGDSTSQGQIDCTARVANPDGFQTSETQPISWDTEGPGSMIMIRSPAGLSCGGSVVPTAANDVDNDLSNGFQISVQALASDEESIDMRVVNGAGATNLTEIGEDPFPLTLEPGSNTLQSFAVDEQGNIGTSVPCLISVTDIVLTVSEPTNSGVLSSEDGITNGDGKLEVTVCGTVSLPTNVTVAVTVAPDMYPATVTNGAWCTDAPVEFAEGNHVVEVEAASTTDTRVGTLSIPVAVDLSAPPAPASLTLSSPNRQEILASWPVVTDAASYVVRYSTSAFTDFFTQGTQVPNVGSDLSVAIAPLVSGQEYFVGVAAVDANGNVSTPTFAASSIVPNVDVAATLIPENSGDGVIKQFGAQIVGGDFDNDGFSDIAVSAPFQTTPAGAGSGAVYLYFGSATGVSETADVVIESVDANGHLGDAMARISWNTAGLDDLAVSSWEVNRVYIYDNATLAAAKASGTPPAAPNLTITPGAGTWFDPFNGGVNGFGTSLAAGQLDAAGTAEDLVIGIPFASGSAFGGAAIVYGGVPTANTVVLSELVGGESGMNGLAGHYFENPAAAPFSSVGSFVAYLGDTRIGDGVGDIAVGALTEFEAGDHRAYVVRGRTAPAAGLPMQEITFGGNDLEIILPGSAGGNSAFGQSFGSIAGGGGTGLRNLVISSALENSDQGSVYIVDGGQTGTLTLTDSSDYLAKISGVAATARFGGAIANNAVGGGSDFDGNGTEDLVIAGGRTPDIGVYIWYSDAIPVGDTTAATRSYFARESVGFSNSFDSGSRLPIVASWVGDVNNDGQVDICWGDAKYIHPADPAIPGDLETDDEGLAVVLSDDGL